MSGRVMFYVQHLLGVGHLKRASVIARAMVAADLDVMVVLGGPEVPGVSFDGCARVMLPAVRATDETFKVLVKDDGEPIDDGWRDQRLARLLAEFEAACPDTLLIEQFPFGRRQFRFELMPLLAAARTSTAPPHVVSSVRDVLVQKSNPKRQQEMITLARTWFDRILVHGDPEIIRLDASLPEANTLAGNLAYTGYVVDADALPSSAADRESGRGEVIVSVGGGAVGEPLLRTALAAKPLSRLSAHVWRLITGPNLANAVFDELAWDPAPGIIVERWRPDLSLLLRNCVLSISQGGYNTIMDVLQARTRAIVVPFCGGAETEQAFRARAFADRGMLMIVDEPALSPSVLAETIDRAIDFSPRLPPVDFDGAENTARIIQTLCRSAGARGH